jgi:YHS domain-containing protein
MIRVHRSSLSLWILFVAVLAVTGCGGGTDTADAVVSEAADAAETIDEAAGMAPEEMQEAVQAILAKADEQDGQADRVVSKCIACALMMDGEAEYHAEHAGYELHFCSEHCRDTFTENADQALLAVDLSEPEVE